MSLLSIPNELQSGIFAILPRKDLVSLIQASKHLHDVSIKILYRKVVLNRWDHLHSFFIPFNNASDVREGRRLELECIKELWISLKGTPYLCDALYPIPKHFEVAPISIPILRVAITHKYTLSPLLAALKSSDFQTTRFGGNSWDSPASPSSLAEDVLRRELRINVSAIQPFCLSKFVELLTDLRSDELTYVLLQGRSRLREIIADEVDSLHRRISQLGLATIHSLPTELLSQILSYPTEYTQYTLLSCLLVNQRIHDIAVPILYTTVVFKTWPSLESFFSPSKIFPPGSELAVRHAERRREEWDGLRDIEINFSFNFARGYIGSNPQIPTSGFFPVPPSLKSDPLVVRNIKVRYPSAWKAYPDPSPLLTLLSYLHSNTFVLASESVPTKIVDATVEELVASKARKELGHKVGSRHRFCATTLMDYLIELDPEELLRCTQTPALFKVKLREAIVLLHDNISSEGLATFSSLPSDLKSRVLSYLPFSSLRATIYISKDFYSATLPFLYNLVTLRSWKRVESFFFHPPSNPATPLEVAARINNRRSELRLVRHLVLDFQSECNTSNGTSIDLASSLSPSSYLTSNPLLLSRLTIIHYDLLDPLLPILRWLNPSSLAVQSLGGYYTIDPTWRTLVSSLPSSTWTRITHVELGVHHTQPLSPIRSNLLASSPFREASSGALSLAGGAGRGVDWNGPDVVSLFNAICPRLEKVKVVVPSSTKGMKKTVQQMLKEKGWDEKWESLEVVTSSSLKLRKAAKVAK